MSIENQDGPLCPGCQQVVSLLHQAHRTLDQQSEPDPFAVIEGLPFLLESTLTHLLAGFEYEAQRVGRLGDAVRLLSMAAAQAEGLRVRADELRRPSGS
jgi:hypothetical protein